MSPVGEEDGTDKGPNVKGAGERIAALPLSGSVGLDGRRRNGGSETFRKVASEVSAFRSGGSADVGGWSGSRGSGRGLSGRGGTSGTGEGQTWVCAGGGEAGAATGVKRCRGNETWEGVCHGGHLDAG